MAIKKSRTRGMPIKKLAKVKKPAAKLMDSPSQSWYGYSLVFDYVVNLDDMTCDLWKESRLHLDPFYSSLMRILDRVDDEGKRYYRVEFDMTHVSLDQIHEIVGAYLFFADGKILKEPDDSLSLIADDDIEWVRQQM